MMRAIVAHHPKRPTARRLFAFDRALGVEAAPGRGEAGWPEAVEELARRVG